MDVSLVLTADRWIALIHRGKNRRRKIERTGRASRDGRKKGRESPEDDSPALLSVQRAGV